MSFLADTFRGNTFLVG
uniref:Uncharacterized protein n=1 Tax=Arundo donax TaxID=35708 RepID=A0A0A9H6J0_ARUDO